MESPDDWRKDKTAATIAFVEEAEVEMYRRPDMTNGEGYTLLLYVDLLRSGDASLKEPETVEAWLERLRDHYP